MEDFRYIPQSLDFIGFLRSQLTNLQGISTLCFELIQNAEDVKDEQGRGATSRITFDVCDDALWVENDGVFREIDFERMRKVAWGSKKEEKDTIGSFGIGFISVYQITDAPELFSSGRHWVFNPLAEEDRRILERSASTRFTRFRLPWATEQSEVRRVLEIPPIQKERLPEILQEILAAVNLAALFLKQLKCLEVKHAGNLVQKIEIVREKNELLIDDGRRQICWRILEGDFAREADRMRQRYGGLIEEKRISQVKIAIPERPSGDGLLYAFLPTSIKTNLPFHINADFYPSSDRKIILFDSQHFKCEWNRLAIACASRTLAENVDQLLEFMKPKLFWEFATQVKMASSRRMIDDVFRRFWEELKPEIEVKPTVLTILDKKLPPSETILLSSDKQNEAIELLKEFHLNIVHPDLLPYRDLLRETGVQFLKLGHILQVFERRSWTERREINQFPPVLRSMDGWQSLWSLLEELLQSNLRSQSLEAELRQCAIAFGTDGALWPPSHLWKIDEDARDFFHQLEPSVFFDPQKGTFPELLKKLIPEFGLEEGLGVLSRNIDKIKKLWQEGRFSHEALIQWWRRQTLTREHKQTIRNLSIWPARDRSLRPLQGLFLAGNFSDPLGLAELVDEETLGDGRKFLNELEVPVLDFETYVKEWVPNVFQSIGQEKKIKLLKTLADRLEELQSQPSLKDSLLKLPLIWCENDEFHAADNVFFDSDEIRKLLGEKVHFAKIPPDHPKVLDLYRWLGVAAEPRATDILRRIEDLVKDPPQVENIESIQNIFDYLALNWDKWDDAKQKLYNDLKFKAWLPGTQGKSQWYRPKELYAIFRKYLFETQANFLDLKQQQKANKFLEFLGVESEPTVRQVVRHLLHCSQNHREVNKEVYKFLEQQAHAPEIEELLDKPCIYLSSGEYICATHAFWGEHPFGKYRYILGDAFREYHNLLNKLRVKSKPDTQDAIKVLQEIAEEFGPSNRRLEGEENTEQVVINCWKLLSEALDKGEIDENTIKAELGNRKTIPNAQKILARPESLFFEDRPELGKKFNLVRNDLIQRMEGTWRAMEAAGVRRLSQNVRIELRSCKDSRPAPELMRRILGRRSLIQRVIEQHKANMLRGFDINRLDHLECKVASEIQVSWILDIYNRREESKPEKVAAVLDDNILYVSPSNGKYPYIAIGRELAYLLYPEGELPQFALELMQILSASSGEEAHSILDELGYPQIRDAPSGYLESAYVSLGGKEVDELENEAYVSDEGSPQVKSWIETTSSRVKDAKTTDAKITKSQTIQGRTRLISYVYPKGTSLDRRLSEEETQHRREVAQRGIDLVMAYERHNGRNPIDENLNIPHHKGYDILSIDSAGKERYIEVKTINRRWDTSNPAQMTRAEFETARENGERYWLYIVELLDPEAPQIYPIQNPAGLVGWYLFDHGWKEVIKP